MDLDSGEVVVHVLRGLCEVCKKKIEKGPAVQLSSKTNAIRHADPACKVVEKPKTYHRWWMRIDSDRSRVTAKHAES
jgi:hypothetical protein